MKFVYFFANFIFVIIMSVLATISIIPICLIMFLYEEDNCKRFYFWESKNTENMMNYD